MDPIYVGVGFLLWHPVRETIKNQLAAANNGDRLVGKILE
jgi:hypothetical protein